MALVRLNSTIRRIAEETYNRSSKAVAYNESDDAQCEMWRYRLEGLLHHGMAGPRTWARLQELSKKLVDGTFDAKLEGETADQPACTEEPNGRC